MRGIFPQVFSFSVGERKVMNRFVVNAVFSLLAVALPQLGA